ncbi:MAG: hypothetical protein LBQ97_04095 [Fusobacteriaceae bacterium]|nr:hypothetical protein [Fusobacteriaceae bacterium]
MKKKILTTAIIALFCAATAFAAPAKKHKENAGDRFFNKLSKKTGLKRKDADTSPRAAKKSTPAKKAPVKVTELTVEQVEVKNNLLYEIGKEKPFTGVLFSRFPDGKPETKTEWRNGLLNGTYETYFEGGGTRAKSTWTNGQMTKKTTWYLGDGSVDKNPPATAAQDLDSILNRKQEAPPVSETPPVETPPVVTADPPVGEIVPAETTQTEENQAEVETPDVVENQLREEEFAAEENQAAEEEPD